MNLYLIKVWGPCESEAEVRSRLDRKYDSIACVTAPSKSVADQMCYVISTRNDDAKPNHHEIIQIVSSQSFVIGDIADIFRFTEDAVKKMQDTPVLAESAKLHDATVEPAYSLFQAEFALFKKRDDKDSFWIHADSKETARAIFYDIFEKVGYTKTIKNVLNVTLTKVVDPYVFWNPSVHYTD